MHDRNATCNIMFDSMFLRLQIYIFILSNNHPYTKIDVFKVYTHEKCGYQKMKDTTKQRRVHGYMRYAIIISSVLFEFSVVQIFFKIQQKRVRLM